MTSARSSNNIGTVISIRGSVVDIRFDDHLPEIRSLLRTGKDNSIAIEVFSQLDNQRVRGIALTPTQGLARGMKVEDTGKPPLARGFCRACLMCSAIRLIKKTHRPTLNGARFITSRRR